MVTQKAQSSTELDIRNDLSGLAERISASIETGALDNECLQGGRVDGVTLVEIDGTNRLAVQTRVEEPFRILQLGPFWKRQPHCVLEGLAYADDAVVGPDGHPLGAGGFLPLHLFDYAGVGAAPSPRLIGGLVGNDAGQRASSETRLWLLRPSRGELVRR